MSRDRGSDARPGDPAAADGRPGDPGAGDARPTASREQLLEQLITEIRANQRATDEVDQTACQLLGINRTDSRCLDILEQQGRITAGRLAEAGRLTTGAVTAVIDRLERKGYARRVADPTDRRRVLVELTPEARQRVLELMGPLGEAGEPLMERYSDEQLQLFIEFTRLGRELQERHADWLSRLLEEQQR